MYEQLTSLRMRIDYFAARAAFKKMGPRSIKMIIEDFAAENGVTVEQLKSPLRVRKFAWPRQDLMAKLRRETPLSLPEIGREFCRDHATVAHGIKASERRAKQ